MKRTTKTILGITVATTIGAILGISLPAEKRSLLLLRIKAGVKDLMLDLSSLTTKVDTASMELDKNTSQEVGDISSEFIDIDLYETYSSKYEG